MKQIHVDLEQTKVSLYEQQGQGQYSVVFIHGVGENATVWNYHLSKLASYGRMLAVNLPGVVDVLPEFISNLNDYLTFIWRILDALEVDTTILVGSSFGGSIAIGATLQKPHRVKGLGLLCSTGIKLPEVKVMRPDLMSLDEFRQLVYYRPKLFLGLQKETSRKAAEQNQNHVRHLFNKIGLANYISRLSEIQVPTSIIWGLEDKISPVVIGKAYASGIQGAKLTLIEECGHLPHIEKPNQVNMELKNLMERVKQTR